jgi:hypothetical protein
VCRRYADVARELGARVESWTPGHVVLAAIEAPPAADTLEKVSELAVAAALASVCPDRGGSSDVEARVAVATFQRRWEGPLRATSWAQRLPSWKGWLMTAELRTEAGDPVADAFAWVGIDTGTKRAPPGRTRDDA